MRSNSRKIIYFCYIPGVGKVGSPHRSLAKVRPHMIAQGAQMYLPHWKAEFLLHLLSCYLFLQAKKGLRHLSVWNDFSDWPLIQCICHCPDKYKEKFSLCNLDASNPKDGFEHRDYSWNNNGFVILSGLFSSCGEKLEEQYWIFRQTESPAVSAFASSGGGDTSLSKYNMPEDQHLASIWLLKHNVFLKTSKSNGGERERP